MHEKKTTKTDWPFSNQSTTKLSTNSVQHKLTNRDIMVRAKQTVKAAESRADTAKKSKGLKADKQVPQQQSTTPKKRAAKIIQAANIVKKHRWHPGTVALREIRDEQKNKSWRKPAIPLRAFERVVRETARKAIEERGLDNLTVNGDVRWQASAIKDLYQATETYLCELMHQSVRGMAHAKRKTLKIEDLMLTLGAYNAFDHGTIKHDLKGYDDPDAPLIERAVRIAKQRNSGKKAPRKVTPQRNKAAAKEPKVAEPAQPQDAVAAGDVAANAVQPAAEEGKEAAEKETTASAAAAAVVAAAEEVFE